MITVENVSYSYPGQGTNIIDQFSCEFAKGEIVAVTGTNGCGKTTLTRLVNGILRPESGKVTIDGRDTTGLDLFEIGHMVGAFSRM